MATSPAPTAKPEAPEARGHRVRLVLFLDGVAYSARPVPRADLPPGAVRGFDLSRTDRRAGRLTYRIVDGFEGPSCSCGDQTFRQNPRGGICKHLAACLACGLF